MMDAHEDDPLGLFGPKTGKTWEWEQVVHGLGEICVEFQTLETVVKAGIGKLISADNDLMGPLVTAELSFRQSVDLLYTLFADRWEGSDRAKKLKPILVRCIEAEGQRN